MCINENYRMLKFPYYSQHDAMDCGPTCLRMVAKHFGKSIPIDTLRKNSLIGKDGVSLGGIQKAAAKIGIKTIGTKITFKQLISEAPLPAILHWCQNHFVVITPGSKKNKIVIADPAKGIITYTQKEFLQLWASVTDSDEPKGIALLLEPTPAFYEQEDDTSKTLGWSSMLQYAAKHKRSFGQLAAGLLLGSLLQLIFPYLTQSIVDTGISTQNLGFIHIVLAAQFMLFFARTLVEFIRSRILLYVSTHINLSILSNFWVKLMRLPMDFFDTKQTGDILQRINDHHRIEAFITGSLLNAIYAIVSLVVFSFVLLSYNVQIWLLFISGSLLYLLWIRIFLKARRSLDHKKFDAASKENSVTMQLIYGMQEIKLNNAEHLKRWQWEGAQAKLFKLSFRSLSLGQYQQAGAFFINEGKNILITYLVAKMVIDGGLTLGQMLAVQYIIGQLSSPVEQLIGFAQTSQDATISLERLNEIHQLQDEEPTNKTFLQQLPEDKSINIHNLSFTYPGAGNDAILNNISLCIPAGKTTAIVGTSGSGKTTILKLLQMFYSSYTGEIRIGSGHLNAISPYHWRGSTGSVMQDGLIFSDTIENNIALGDESPNYTRLIHACTVANILPFVNSLPLGLHTKIGAEGNGISQGQKQRLLIARAVYKNPDFIFFDEATNALDANNEKIIMQQLDEFFRGRTVLIVAHRLSTVKNADKIVVLEQGKILEEGNHETLTALRGKYYELVKNQLELGN